MREPVSCHNIYTLLAVSSLTFAIVKCLQYLFICLSLAAEMSCSSLLLRLHSTRRYLFRCLLLSMSHRRQRCVCCLSLTPTTLRLQSLPCMVRQSATKSQSYSAPAANCDHADTRATSQQFSTSQHRTCADWQTPLTQRRCNRKVLQKFRLHFDGIFDCSDITEVLDSYHWCMRSWPCDTM